MTATELLRAKLDELGVEYTASDEEHVKETCWNYTSESMAEFAEYYSGTTRFACAVWSFTPEQAIAATVGAWTCEWCKDGKTFDKQTVMMTNHGWQKIRHCPNCGRRIEVSE